MYQCHVSKLLRAPTVNTLPAEACLKLGGVKALSSHIPGIGIFIRKHVIKKATTSRRSEGTRTDLEDVVMKKADVDVEKRDEWQKV